MLGTFADPPRASRTLAQKFKDTADLCKNITELLKTVYKFINFLGLRIEKSFQLLNIFKSRTLWIILDKQGLCEFVDGSKGFCGFLGGLLNCNELVETCQELCRF